MRQGLKGLIIIALILLIFAGGIVTNSLLQERYSYHVQSELEDNAAILKNILGTATDNINALGVFVASFDYLPNSQTMFDEYAASIVDGNSYIRNIIFAPDGINRYVYPLLGNEASLDHNILGDPRPEVREDIGKAIATRRPVFSDPYALRQGGIGLVIRKVVFDENGFLGIVSTVLDVEELARYLGINCSKRNYCIAFYDSKGNQFLGREGILEEHIAEVIVEIGDYRWSIRGYINDFRRHEAFRERLLYFILAFLMLAMGLALFNSVAGYQSRLEEEVKTKTNEIDQINQRLREDIDKRKELATELEKSKVAADAANRSKSEFLANMSHEIRTPMNGVIGMAELLTTTSLDEEQKQYIKMIKASADSLLKIINDILDLSKIEMGNIELNHQDFDMEGMCDTAIEMVSIAAHKKGLELNYYIQQEAMAVFRGDRDRISQILVNILSNAIKFTPSGEVYFGVKASTKDDIVYQIDFIIRDTGVGIEESKLKNIFSSFTQVDSSTKRRYEGTGLGLTISDKLSQKMGGRIEVSSVLGKGSTFTFSLSLSKPMANIAAKDFKSISGKKILLVDDSPRTVQIITKYLESLGVSYSVRYDGESALKDLRSNHYDALILDLNMPGLDGIDVIREIRKESLIDDKKIMITMTQVDLVDYRDEMQRYSINTYILKPVRRKELYETLKYCTNA